jgi:hypothetical protein
MELLYDHILHLTNITEKKYGIFLGSESHFNPVACPIEIPDLVLEQRHAMLCYSYVMSLVCGVL